MREYSEYCVKLKKDEISYLDLFKIAIIGPRVQNFLEMQLDLDFIIKILPCFKDTRTLISWVCNAFRCDNPYLFFEENFIDAGWYLKEYGVDINPKIDEIYYK